jgi:hypothetical protein
VTAYLVSTYHRPRQAARLIERLAAAGDATVLVHHDLGADPATYTELRERVGNRPGVVFLPRIRCRYALFDHVRVTLSGMRHLCERSEPFGHLVLLTGQCYPIKAMADIESHLVEQSDRSIIECHRLPRDHWPDGGFNRVDAWSYPVDVGRLPAPVRRVLPKRQQYLSIPKPALVRHRLGGTLEVRLPRGVDHLYGGLGYWALAERHVRYVDAHHDRLERFFRRSYIPDELFFQTALRNSPHADEITSERIHLVDYTRHGGLSPYVYRSEDFDLIAEASTRPLPLFARKFDEQVDAAVLDRIDAELLGIAVEPEGR